MSVSEVEFLCPVSHLLCYPARGRETAACFGAGVGSRASIRIQSTDPKALEHSPLDWVVAERHTLHT